MHHRTRLATERLVLRFPTRRDVDAIHAIAANRRVARFMLFPQPYRREHAVSFVKRSRDERRAGVGYHFLAVRRDDRAVLGAAALLAVREEHRRAELGYWFGHRYWRHGYASEAVARLLRLGFAELRLHRIYAFTLAGNEPSARLLPRHRFALEGVQRQQYKHRGRWRDLEAWGLLRSEWQP